MNGIEKLDAAFLKEGSRELPVVICYEGIYIRDHVKQLTSLPWWYAHETDIEKQIDWHGGIAKNIGQDWFAIPGFYSRDERKYLKIKTRSDGVYRVNTKTCEEFKLREPIIGGENYSGLDTAKGPKNEEEAEAMFRGGFDGETEDIIESGRADLARELINGACSGLSPVRSVSTPLYNCVYHWGFSNFMVTIVDNPGLLTYVCDIIIEKIERGISDIKKMGAEIIWIEECFLDMINPEMYKKYNLPYVRRITDAIRGAGMKSVYYHCGDPKGKMDLILDAGADAVSFEESKKGFEIEIEKIVEYVDGRCAVFGNLDAINFLPRCTESELRGEIERFVRAGRKNKSRFVMSIGSPVTPGTTAEKVRLYCETAREIGSR